MIHKYRGNRQAISALATTLMLALWLHAAQPIAAQTPVAGSLAGQLLVAAPTMGDPRFARTVILMARHAKDGAFGIAINRPIGEHPRSAILQLLGDKDYIGTEWQNRAKAEAKPPAMP